MSTLTNLKAMLLSWNTTTFQSTLLDIILYAFIGALCFWFLIALYYDFRNNRVKKHSQQRINSIEQERTQLSESLETTTQQLSQSKHQLTQSEQALTLKQQRIEELEDAVKLAQVKINHGLALESQITAALTTLPTDFFAAAESPAATTENTSSWQRYHSAVNDLIVRLQTYAQDQLQLQQEKNQLNAALHEQALTIKTLQQKEIATDAQISQLEQIIDDTQALLQEQQIQFDTHKRPSTISNQASAPLTAPSVIETADNALESIAHQAEDVIDDVVSGLRSAFQPAPEADQPITQAAPALTTPTPVATPSEAPIATKTVTTSLATTAKTTAPKPASKLKTMFSFGKKPTAVPVTKAITTPTGKTVPPVTKEAPKTPTVTPLQTTLSISNTTSKASTQSAAKGKSLFGFFNKEAISDYIEAALEKNDEIVAKETLKESLTEDQTSAIKPKSLWQKISFSKK